MRLTFVETPLFTRQVAECLEDEELRRFQNQLLADPDRGDVLVGCSGLRKARLAQAGRGKRGSARVIYLHLPRAKLIYLFLLYRKSDAEELSAVQRKELAVLCSRIKASHASQETTP